MNLPCYMFAWYYDQIPWPFGPAVGGMAPIERPKDVNWVLVERRKRERERADIRVRLVLQNEQIVDLLIGTKTVVSCFGFFCVGEMAQLFKFIAIV